MSTISTNIASPPSPLSRQAIRHMPLLWGSAAFLLGIALGDAFQPGWVFWFCSVLFGLALTALELFLPALVSIKTRRTSLTPLPLGIFLLLLSFGAWCSLPSPTPSPDQLSYYNERGSITITGVIDSMPERSGSTSRAHFRAQTVTREDGISLSVSGLALLELPAGDWAYGDLLELTCSPETPPDGTRFSYRDYLDRQGIRTLISYPQARWLGSGEANPLLSLLYSFRLQAYEMVNRLWPQPEASLLAGILLGIESDLPASLTEAFQATGTSHIIAISGFNMAVMASLCAITLGRLFRHWKGALASLVVITLYTLLVGAQPSVVRAAVMGGLSILAMQLGRRGAGLNTLAITGALMCLIQPGLLWSASFQLSSLATLGLVLFAELGEEHFFAWFKKRWGGRSGAQAARWISEYILFTLAAQLATLPVLAYSFQQISISALLANPLILPVQPLVMILSGLAVLLGMVLFPLGQLLAWLAWPVAAYTIRLVELLARIPGGVLSLGGISAASVFLLYTLMAVILIFWQRIRRTAGSLAGLGTLGLVSIVLWQAVFMRPDGSLHCIISSEPGAASVLILTPSGRRVSLGTATDALLERRLPALDRQLDAAVINGSSAQLYQMVRLTETLPVDAAFWALGEPSTRAARTLEETLRLGGTESTLLLPGDRLQLDEELILTTLAVEEAGTAYLVEYGHFRLLIPGGLPPDDFEEERRASILLLTSLDADYFQEWERIESPLVICPFGTPLPGCASTETWLEVTTDGDGLWLEEGI